MSSGWVLPEEQNIDVDGAWTFRLGTLTAEFAFDCHDLRQKIFSFQLCLKCYRTVEEPGLIGELTGSVS